MTTDAERAWYQYTWDKAINRRASNNPYETEQFPELNTRLLLDTMSHIESNPDSHDQRMWATRTECGTKFCFAGRAVACAIPGSRPNIDYSDNAAGSVILPDTGLADSYDAVAKRVLGITAVEAQCLFSATNTIGNLRELVDQLVEAEQTRLSGMLSQ